MAGKPKKVGSAAPKPKGQKGALFKNPQLKLAKFLIDKFLKKDQVLNLFLELPAAYKLLKKFNNEYFWRNLPVEFRIQSLHALLNEKALERLTLLWRVYQKQLRTDSKIIIPEIKEVILEENNIGPDFVLEKKPKSMIDFCRMNDTKE